MRLSRSATQCAGLTLVALSILLTGPSQVKADLITHADVNGLGTFEDTNTGLVWLKLNDFFNLSYDQMAVIAQANGFTMADVSQVHQLLDPLPLDPGGADWAGYAAITGQAPDRQLMWGAYLPENQNGDISWAFANQGDTAWHFVADTGIPTSQVPNGGSRFADMDLWAFQAGGQSVAPEPGSLTLLACGAVGLLSYAGLRRKRACKVACAA